MLPIPTFGLCVYAKKGTDDGANWSKWDKLRFKREIRDMIIRAMKWSGEATEQRVWWWKVLQHVHGVVSSGLVWACGVIIVYRCS